MEALSLHNPLFATDVVAATRMILKAVAMSWLTVLSRLLHFAAHLTARSHDLRAALQTTPRRPRRARFIATVSLPRPTMTALPHMARLLCGAGVALALAACTGGEVGGSLSGLGSGRSVTLLNNGSNALTLDSNGSFAFTDTLAANASYAVTVETQPAGQSCSVSNGSGSIDADGTSVDSVRVDCAFSASLRGTVSGLPSGAALTLDNDGRRLAIAADGPFAFAATLADGTPYDVRVLVQPAGATCVVQNGSGSFFAASFQDIVVSCS